MSTNKGFQRKVWIMVTVEMGAEDDAPPQSEAEAPAIATAVTETEVVDREAETLRCPTGPKTLRWPPAMVRESEVRHG